MGSSESTNISPINLENSILLIEDCITIAQNASGDDENTDPIVEKIVVKSKSLLLKLKTVGESVWTSDPDLQANIGKLSHQNYYPNFYGILDCVSSLIKRINALGLDRIDGNS